MLFVALHNGLVSQAKKHKKHFKVSDSSMSFQSCIALAPSYALSMTRVTGTKKITVLFSTNWQCHKQPMGHEREKEARGTKTSEGNLTKFLDLASRGILSWRGCCTPWRGVSLGEGAALPGEALFLPRLPEACLEPCFPAFGQIGVPTSNT